MKELLWRVEQPGSYSTNRQSLKVLRLWAANCVEMDAEPKQTAVQGKLMWRKKTFSRFNNIVCRIHVGLLVATHVSVKCRTSSQKNVNCCMNCLMARCHCICHLTTLLTCQNHCNLLDVNHCFLNLYLQFSFCFFLQSQTNPRVEMHFLNVS